MSPRSAARLIAGGRIALGAAVLAAPERVTARWLGAENARHPAVADLARGLAARDIALGLAALQTLDDRRAGPRVQLGCALADGADALGTLLARKHLPALGAIGTVAIAGGSAALGVYIAGQLG
ncbi:MAG TPA: hypothetical protein VKV16_08855 [Solirubrobacteraceae bacterium]|nr:hypothetical protein [Solirubrobacteraceae bacterium]